MWTQINLGFRNVVLKKCVLSINHLTFTQNIIWKMSRLLLRNISLIKCNWKENTQFLYNYFIMITYIIAGKIFFMSINWIFISKTKQWNYLFRGFIFKWIMVYQAVYFTILRYHSLRTRFADFNNVMPVWLMILKSFIIFFYQDKVFLSILNRIQFKYN